MALNLGQPGERGNLLGIQPELFAADYQSVERLRLKLAAYLEKARAEGLINDRTVVVLPEHIGTWLVAAGEKDQVYSAHTLDDAMLWLAAANPMKLARALVAAEGEQRLVDALFRMKATRMAGDYQALFGGLAREFGITLVAGSILLPRRASKAATCWPRAGRCTTSAWCSTARAGPWASPSASSSRATRNRASPPPRDRPAPGGRHPGRAAGRAGQRRQLVPRRLHGAARTGRRVAGSAGLPHRQRQLEQALARRKGAPAPDDANLQADKLSEGEAWQRLALAGHQPGSGARAGMTVFLRGQLWDMGSDGPGLAADANGIHIAEAGRGAKLLNIWL